MHSIRRRREKLKNPDRILRHIAVTSKPPPQGFNRKDPNIRKILNAIPVRSLKDLEKHRDKYFVWLGVYVNSYPSYNVVRVPRILYDTCIYVLPDNWKLKPIETLHPTWDVNPWKFTFASDFYSYVDKPLPPPDEIDEIEELAESIAIDFEHPETLDTIHQHYQEMYSFEEIEEACKRINRSIKHE